MSSVRKKKVLNKHLSPIEHFSVEILLRIFDYMDPFLLLGSVALVNKKMNSFVHNPSWFWKAKLQRHFQTAKKSRNLSYKDTFINKFETNYATLNRDGRVLMSLIKERDTEGLSIIFPKLEKDKKKMEALLFQTYQNQRMLDYLQGLNHQATLDNLYAQLMPLYDTPSVSSGIWGWLGWRVRSKVTIRLVTEWAIFCRQSLEAFAQIVSEEYDLRTMGVQGQTLLYLAAQEGHQPAVAFICERLKSNPAHLEIGSKDGSSPLYIAAQNNRLGAVETLLANGANPHARFRNEFTPLYIAAQNGNSSIVLRLLNHGVEIDAKCKNGSTPLYIAAQLGRLEVVDILLDHGASVEAFFKTGFTPLYVASRNGHPGVVKRLLKAGANIEENSGDGSTPLYIASQNGHAEVVRLLLNAHANLRAQFMEYRSLHVAAQNGHDLVVGEMMGYLDRSLWYEGSRDEILNYSRVAGETALYVAAQNGHPLVVARLVEGGAEINAQYDGRYRPIHIAAIKKHFEVVRLLIKKDALALGCSIADLNTEPLFKVLLTLKAYIDKANQPQQLNFFQSPNLNAQRLAVNRLLNDLLDMKDSTVILSALWDEVKEHGITDPALCQQLEQFSDMKSPVPAPCGP